MTRLLGSGSLLVALGVAVFGAIALVVGARSRRSDMLRSGELAVYAVWGLVTIATLAMIYGLVAHDFSIRYVAMVGSRATPLFYTVISLWGALEGSILFWIFVLSSLSALVTYQNRTRDGTSVPSRVRFWYVTSAESDESTKIQKRTEPSSAPHSEMTV